MSTDPPQTYCLWAHHAKVGRWLPLITGLAGRVAVDERVIRADRCRRSGQPCEFRVLPDGERPV